jgi:hypothetical protein
VDWTFGTANVTFSYAVELRDTGRWNIFFLENVLLNCSLLGEYGFLLPENQILPSGRETLAGELALLKYIEGQVYA